MRDGDLKGVGNTNQQRVLDEIPEEAPITNQEEYSNNKGIINVTQNLFANGKISLIIETENLILQHATLSNLAEYKTLFSNEKVMEKYLNGTRDETWVQKRLSVYEERLKSGNPLSGFAIYKRGEDNINEFIGHGVVGSPDLNGEVEIAGISFPDYWNKGYGSEAANALINLFIPYLHANKELFPKIMEVKSIVATARFDNEQSHKICQNIVGFGEAEKMSGEGKEQRSHYKITMEQLLSNCQQIEQDVQHIKKHSSGFSI